MAMIRNLVGIVGVCLFATGVATGSREGVVVDEPPRPVDVLREALQPARTVKDPSLRDALLHDLTNALALLGAVPDAITAKDAIGDPRVRESSIPIIIKAQAEQGDVAGALRMAAALDTSDAERLGYRDSALSRIAGAQARAGDWVGAVRTARRCRPGARAAAIVDVIRTRAESGDLDGAIHQAEGLEDDEGRGGVPDASPRRLAIVKVARLLAARDDLDRAHRLVDAHPDVTAEGLAAIALARFKAKDMDAAATAARRLLDHGGDWQSEAIARVVLVRALIAQDKLDAAIKVADGPWKEPELTRENRFMQPSVEPLHCRALVSIARAQVEQGHLDAGVATLANVRRGLARASRLLGLARERLEKGDRPAAEKLVTAAREAMEGPGGSESYLAEVGAAMARCGQIEPARRLFARALFARDIGPASNRSNVPIYQVLGGDLEGARRTIAAIPEAEVRDQARLWIAVHHARDGKADAALDVASAIADATVRATTTAQVGMILAERGDRDRGAATCRRAVEIVGTPTREVARILAHAWAAVPGEADAALDWARRRPTPELRVAALLGAAWGLGKRPFWVLGSSRLVIPAPIEGQQAFTNGDVDI